MRRTLLLSLMFLAACLPDRSVEDSQGPAILTADEAREEIEELALDLVTIRGRVINDELEVPLSGATVRVGEESDTTAGDGSFEFAVRRVNNVALIEASGFRSERLPLWLFRRVDDAVDLGEIELRPDRADEVRMIFGGDVALGRRYLDPEGVAEINEVPPPNSDALISVDSALEDTNAIFESIAPLLSSADYAGINLESVVTNTPYTPAEGRRFIFFTLPESVPALTSAGVDYVALANNHTLDYSNQGVLDTIASVEEAGLAHSGLGTNAEIAFAPHDVQLGETSFSIFSMTSIETSRFSDPWSATDESAGTADLTDEERVRETIARARGAGSTVISQLHTGYEYTRLPPEDGYTRERMLVTADAGSALVVGHHPHVAQGFEFRNGALVAHSLGNFAFDQERLETTLGVALEVDFQGDSVRTARARSIYIDEFVPRELAGYSSERFLKRLSRSSLPFGSRVIPRSGWGVIASTDDPGWVPEERSVAVNLTPAGEFAYADLRGVLRDGESIASVELESPAQLSFGEDLLWFGDIEDHDIDDDIAENSTWYVTGGSSFVCPRARRGLLALCSTRNGKSQSSSVISFRNRIRVLGDKTNTPNKDLTALAYISGENAGPVKMLAEHSASFGGKEFGTQTLSTSSRGSFDWRPFWADLDMPEDTVDPPADKPFDPIARIENARATRLKFEQEAPSVGQSLVTIDDVALVSWLPAASGTTFELQTPHNLDFVRVDDASVERVSITLRRWVRRSDLE